MSHQESSRVIKSQINFQLRSTFNWDQLSTEIDFQLRSTFNWDQLSTEINFQLRSTFNWDRPSTEIDFQLRQSTWILFQLSYFSTTIATYNTFRLVNLPVNIIWLSTEILAKFNILAGRLSLMSVHDDDPRCRVSVEETALKPLS